MAEPGRVRTGLSGPGKDRRSRANTLLSDRGRARWSGPRLAILALICAAPAFSDPAGPDHTTAGCWRPGMIQDLFSWSGSPGITCRDASTASVSALGSAPASVHRPVGDNVGDNTGASGASQFSFSGSAHVGIAVAF